MNFNCNKTASRLCYIAPYCNVLTQYGYNITEAYLLGISKSINFRYYYIHNYNKPVTRPLSSNDRIIIIGAKSDVSDVIVDCFGIQFYETIMDNPLELCKTELKMNRWIIALVDSYHLKYHPQYQNVHAQTTIVLYDWNDDEKCFSFIDSHVTTMPISCYTGYLSDAEFMEALIIGENVYNEMPRGLILHRLAPKQSEIDIRKQVKKNCLEILNAEEVNSGIAGMLNLADEMEKWADFWPSDSIKNVMRQGYHHITSRGGPAISREVYADFLVNYLKYDGNDDQLQFIAKGFMDSAQKWTAIAAKFFRNSLSFSEKRLDETVDGIRQIAGIENDLFNNLLKYLGDT